MTQSEALRVKARWRHVRPTLSRPDLNTTASGSVADAAPFGQADDSATSTSVLACQDLPGLAAADHCGELVAVGAVAFAACVVEVALHGAHRHRKSFGDIAIGQARGDKIGDLAFAYGQRL